MASPPPPPTAGSAIRSADEDSLLELAEHLPAEAGEALLELATGGRPRIPEPLVPAINPFNHPDAQRRFRVITNVEELRQALDFPWERWMIFLHPEQRQWVEREYRRLARGPRRTSRPALNSPRAQIRG